MGWRERERVCEPAILLFHIINSNCPLCRYAQARHEPVRRRKWQLVVASQGDDDVGIPQGGKGVRQDERPEQVRPARRRVRGDQDPGGLEGVQDAEGHQGRTLTTNKGARKFNNSTTYQNATKNPSLSKFSIPTGGASVFVHILDSVRWNGCANVTHCVSLKSPNCLWSVRSVSTSKAGASPSSPPLCSLVHFLSTRARRRTRRTEFSRITSSSLASHTAWNEIDSVQHFRPQIERGTL